jgi:hypothetical protein
MRNYLTGKLRCRFDIAWQILPAVVRDRLKPMLVSVKAVDSLKGALVKCSDGSVVQSEKDGSGWFVPDLSADRKRGFIIVSNFFGEGSDEASEACAVVTFLHELAHAIQYVENGWGSDELPDSDGWEEARFEVAAWLQAGCWLANNSMDYQAAADAIRFAIVMANNDLSAWRKSVLSGSQENGNTGFSEPVKQFAMEIAKRLAQ